MVIVKTRSFMYNTMMTPKTYFLIGVTALALMHPLVAGAYVSPEDVLLQDSFMNNFTPPPSARTAAARTAEQDRLALQQRQAAQAAYFSSQHAAAAATSSSTAGQAGSASSTNADLQDVLNSLQQTIDGLRGDQNTEEAKRTARLLGRIQDNQQSLSGDATMHSGAPLTSSGPATIFTIALLGGAMLYTMRRAKGSEQQTFQA